MLKGSLERIKSAYAASGSISKVIPFHVQVCARRVMQAFHLCLERRIFTSVTSALLLPSSEGRSRPRGSVIEVDIRLRIGSTWNLVDLLYARSKTSVKAAGTIKA
jgi:hypothetical protein